MGIPVLILGESGSGKTASLRNFEANEVGIFNVASKPLPFKKPLPVFNSSDYNTIMAKLPKATAKSLVIDDSQYLMVFEEFNRAKEVGYNKYSEMADHFYKLVQLVINKLPPDTIVYFLHHTATDSNTGRTKAKTVGKMIDDKLTLEGMFSIVLYTQADGKSYKFVTQTDGFNTAKSPMEMFPREMDNDLKAVDGIIRDYYNLNSTKEGTAS